MTGVVWFGNLESPGDYVAGSGIFHANNLLPESRSFGLRGGGLETALKLGSDRPAIAVVQRAFVVVLGYRAIET